MTFFKKKGKKRRQVHALFAIKTTIILPFKKAVVYILSIKKYGIRKWRQVEFKKGL